MPTPAADSLATLIAEARARAEKAHKGPWHIHEGDLVDENHDDVFTDWEEAYGPNGDEVGPDTDFICHAQQDVIALADALESVAKERDEALNALMQINNCAHPKTVDDAFNLYQEVSGIAFDAVKGKSIPSTADRDALLKFLHSLAETLDFYAAPTTYFAIAFVPDEPAGAFMDDFSKCEDEFRDDWFKPGKRARAAVTLINQELRKYEK